MFLYAPFTSLSSVRLFGILPLAFLISLSLTIAVSSFFHISSGPPLSDLLSQVYFLSWPRYILSLRIACPHPRIPSYSPTPCFPS